MLAALWILGPPMFVLTSLIALFLAAPLVAVPFVVVLPAVVALLWELAVLATSVSLCLYWRLDD